MGKSGNRGSLKAALLSHQSRLQKKEKAAKAASVADKKTSKSKSISSSKEKARPPRVTVPFNPTDKILLVGEGNFSFACALVCDPPSSLEFLPPGNVTATAYDTERECYAKYPEAKGNVTRLKEKGAIVLFGTDAVKLEKCAPLKNSKWDRIVWNFPHAGKGMTDQDRNILSNQMLILGFLRSAANFLTSGPIPSFTSRKKQRKSEDDEDEDEDMVDADNQDDDALSASRNFTSASRGTVLITLRNVSPYTLWDVPKLAKNPPPSQVTGAKKANPRYIQLRSFAFHRKAWTGYEHRMTKGERANGVGTTGQGGEDRTWEFCLRD